MNSTHVPKITLSSKTKNLTTAKQAVRNFMKPVTIHSIAVSNKADDASKSISTSCVYSTPCSSISSQVLLGWVGSLCISHPHPQFSNTENHPRKELN